MLFRKRNDEEISLNNYKITALIGAETVIEGALISKSSVRIDGTLVGGVTADGVVILSKGGRVKGNIIAENVIIAGVVEGNIKAREKVNVEPTGEIYGDITTKKLLIDEESVFQGQCFMNRDKVFETAEERMRRIDETKITFWNRELDEERENAREKAEKEKAEKEKEKAEKDAADNNKVEIEDKTGESADDCKGEKSESVSKASDSEKKTENKAEKKVKNEDAIDNSSVAKKTDEKNVKTKEPALKETVKNTDKSKEENPSKEQTDKPIEKIPVKKVRAVTAEERAVKEMNKKALRMMLDSSDRDIDYLDVNKKV